MRFLLKSARLAWLLACTDPASCWRHRHCLSRDCHRLSVFVSMVGLMMKLRIWWFSFLKNETYVFADSVDDPVIVIRDIILEENVSDKGTDLMETLLDFQDIVFSPWLDWNGKDLRGNIVYLHHCLLSQKCDLIREFFKWILWSIIKRSGLWSAKARASLHICSTRTSSI